MNVTRSQNRDAEALGWGAVFIWWGITELFPALPAGTGLLGFGLILLGVSYARRVSGLPASRFFVTIGFLAALWGMLDLAGAFLKLPFEIPVFAILLMAFGLMIFVDELISNRSETRGEIR